MARAFGHDDPTTDIVYDSQEEADAWPVSQPSNIDGEAALFANGQAIITEYERRPRNSTPNAGFSDHDVEDEVLQVPTRDTPAPSQSKQVPRSRATSILQPQSSQRNRTSTNERTTPSESRQPHDIFHFESSDDDLPLLRMTRNVQTPASSVPSSPLPNLDPIPVSSEIPCVPVSLEKSPTPPRRALRARRPEQQMPYTLDLIRHRDQFRRRGLKPVHNPDSRPQIREEDEQYQADDDEGEGEIDKDERYISPKDIEEREPKRRRFEENLENQNHEAQVRTYSRHRRKKFIDPSRFDVRKSPKVTKAVQQVTPARELSIYDFPSDDELGFLPPPSSPTPPKRITPQVRSPRQTITPVSNDNIRSSPNPPSHDRPINRPILVPSDSDESDPLPSSIHPFRRRAQSPSTSSSSSDNEAIERLKKKARGVLPGSFFTAQARVASKPSHTRPAATIDTRDQDRRGVAKTKFGNTNQSSRFAYPVSTDSEPEGPVEVREKRHFVDLTREETIQDDHEGWDIEEDLIDRMLNWGGKTSSRPKPKTVKRKQMGSHDINGKQKRKRQRRINEYTVSDVAPSKAQTKRGPKLSIVDACDVMTARGDRSPPPFMKVARRQSRNVKNYGRRKAPNRKMFSFAEEDDQEDVQTVITEWENGSLADGIEKRLWQRPVRQPGTAKRKPTNAPKRTVSGPKKATIKRTPLAPLPEENRSVSEDPESPEAPERPLINKFLRPGAPIIAIVDAKHSRGRIEQYNAAYPTGQVEGTTRVRLPGPKARYPRRPNDVAAWLRNAAPPDEAESGFPDVLNDTAEFSPPPPTAHAQPRLRKPQKPRRRDVNRFDKRYQRNVQTEDQVPRRHQLSLDDVWFPNDASSLTFGVAPVTEGTYLESNTLIGRRVLAIAMATKPAVEAGNNLWRTNEAAPDIDIQAACDNLATSLDEILDSIDALRLSDGEETTVNRVHRQIVDFAETVSKTLRGLSTGEIHDIKLFGSKAARLAEIAMDRLDGTVLADAIDLNDRLILLALSVIQTLSVISYQLCVLTSHDLSILGAGHLLSRLSRRLLQCLLNGGFEPLQNIIRRIKAKNARDDGLGSDSILIDIWATLYHVLENVHETLRQNIPTFWSLLQAELEIDGTMDGKILDRAWYTIMNISTMTVFNSDGIARAPSNGVHPPNPTTIWNIVETIVNPYLQSYSTFQHHRYDTYIRTLFGRCHTLIATWGWSHGAKTTLTSFYTFFAERRFDNLKTEAFGGFPKFFQQGTSLDIQTSDNTFVIFLKLLVVYVTQQQSHLRGTSKINRREFLAASKDLDRFVNRVTPLRTYQSTFAPLDYIALQNHYCLLLTLYWIAPGRSRPSVERIRDVIDIEKAPVPAQVICMETWSLLIQLQLKKEEEITSTVDWFLVMFRHSMKEYQLAARPGNMDDTTVAGQVKSRIRSLESIVLKALQSLGDIVHFARETAGPLVEDVAGLVVKSSHELPPSVLHALLVLLRAFFVSVDKNVARASAPVTISIDQDSQDYGDASFMEEFIAVQDASDGFPIGAIVANCCNYLYQVISNFFASTKPDVENLAACIDIWILGKSILVRHGQQDWVTFLQYAGEWERLRSTNTKTSRAWCPYILTKVLSVDASAYHQGTDHFISAWFESIVEPDLERQHALTALLLNIDDQNIVLVNSIFARNTAGEYDITSDALFEARPVLIVHALANMGRHYDTLVQEGDRAAISICKQRYLDYLHRMLSAMQSIYLEMKNTESEDLVQYISLAQHVVGNVIQYCASFIKEIDRTFKDLPILDFFTNSETFPQPGSNEIGFAAQRLRGVARKDSHRPFSNATRTDIFWSIKSSLEKSVRSNREWEFVEFCVLALCEDKEEAVGDHVGLLRTFVVHEIFCEYLKIAKEAPDVGNPVWVYVLPCLAAIREIYACVWESLVREDTVGLGRFTEDLMVVMLAMQGILDLVDYRNPQSNDSVYLAVTAKIFDFGIFVDHVAFYIQDLTQIKEQVDDMNHILSILRLAAQGVEAPLEDRAWAELLQERRGHGGYIHSTVRREIMRGIQSEIASVSKEKMEQIRRVFAGVPVRPTYNEIAEICI